MKRVVRLLASLLIALTSGVIAPDVWTPNAPLPPADQTHGAIRAVAGRTAVATATTVIRFALDSRIGRERRTLPSVLPASGLVLSSRGMTRWVPRQPRRKPDLFVPALLRVRAPPLAFLNS